MNRVLFALIAVIIGAAAAATWVARAGSEVHGAPGDQPWAQDRMQFVAWNNERWTAWISDGEFVLMPENTRRWSRHRKATVAFVDWQGEPWQARIDGELFTLAPRRQWASAETSHAIRYRDWAGAPRIRTVQQLTR
jgi:hypothetical protein